MRTIVVVAVVVFAVVASACGFECSVKGEPRQFSGCDALQAAFDEEQARAQPDGAVLDDLDTCGAAYGCAVKP